MKQMKLWMLAAILTCGLATTSCSDDDNDSPVQPADEIEAQLGFDVDFAPVADVNTNPCPDSSAARWSS